MPGNPNELTVVETALQNCGLLKPISEAAASTTNFNLWDALIISLEQLAKSGNQLWAFETAIEEEWKQLKHNIQTIPEMANQSEQASPNLLDEDLQFQRDLDSTTKNPFHIEDSGKMFFNLNSFFALLKLKYCS